MEHISTDISNIGPADANSLRSDRSTSEMDPGSVDRRTLSQTIIDHFRSSLFAGEMRAGDYVGTEASIAAQFDVSRMAARDAIRALVAQGLVVVRKGGAGGVRIASGDMALFSDTLAVQFRLLGMHETELVEAQISLEASTSALAAQYAEADDIAELRACLDRATSCLDDPIGFKRETFAFHLALAKASRNRVLEALVQGVLHVLGDLYTRNTTHERAELLVDIYRAILEAIERKDVEVARALMTALLRRAQAALFDTQI